MSIHFGISWCHPPSAPLEFRYELQEVARRAETQNTNQMGSKKSQDFRLGMTLKGFRANRPRTNSESTAIRPRHLVIFNSPAAGLDLCFLTIVPYSPLSPLAIDTTTFSSSQLIALDSPHPTCQLLISELPSSSPSSSPKAYLNPDPNTICTVHFFYLMRILTTIHGGILHQIYGSEVAQVFSRPA
jgi:hypothetical protein